MDQREVPKEMAEAQDTITAGEYLAAQEEQHRAAADILSGQIDTCSYPRGHVRQQVYSCLTCSPDGTCGVCYACFVQCHTTHDVVELFYKRAFRCDCGTLPNQTCQLMRKSEERNQENVYTDNFRGRFCFCKKLYDPDTEESVMYQCVLCEDWMHDACIAKELQGGDSYVGWDYICRGCVGLHPFLRDYTGTTTGNFQALQAVLVGRDSKDDPPHDTTSDSKEGIKEDSKDGSKDDSKDEAKEEAKEDLKEENESKKRGREEEEEEENGHKKVKSEDEPSLKLKLKEESGCIRPPKVTSSEAKAKAEESPPLDLFCKEGWRQDLCSCPACLQMYTTQGILFITTDEASETYDPEPDADAGTSLHDMGLQKLSTHMDRETAIHGAMAYQQMKAELSDFLRGFANSGTVVAATDIQQYFEAKQRERHERNRSAI
ncbi:hypothetical protein DFS34DRAFT_654274 [Phlyctochytrium arcticum]|nr:hypothetical protein DFS34DRAFT_654274 [Phlyctochytrium arcticum]